VRALLLTRGRRGLAPASLLDRAELLAHDAQPRETTAQRWRGPPDPLLVMSDGAPGVIRAIEECSRAGHASAVSWGR
jgi:hypothetical protein